MWKPGDRLRHRYNPDLGPGRVVESNSRRLLVEFPDSGEILAFGADSDALATLELADGSRARVEATGEEVIVETVSESGQVFLADGRRLLLSDLWPLTETSSPVETAIGTSSSQAPSSFSAPFTASGPLSSILARRSHFRYVLKAIRNTQVPNCASPR